MRSAGVVMLCLMMLMISCGKKDDPGATPPTKTTTDAIIITADVTDLHQEMIGFGGALTWFSNWVTPNTKINEIADLMFEDSGIDVIRFKNWYYPDNYPTDKTTASMNADGSGQVWDATNTLYTLAHDRNPNIKILLSSWGPPASLKSNGQLQEGTLKKDGTGNFMYDDFAQYWSDVLDHVPFNPDYISIQNEPTFVTSGWTTCEWSNIQTTSLPDYNTAFDKVHSAIAGRTFVPTMVGPESANIPAFITFANDLKSNSNCGVYALHPYDISASTSSSSVTASLKQVGTFGEKLNMITEFSDNLDWYNTALFIQKAIAYANTSGYIYWKLAWNTPASGTDAAMISFASANSNSSYTVTPYFYLVKHFAKYIDPGYHRVGATSSSASLLSTAFLSPDNSTLTIIVINDDTAAKKVSFAAAAKTIKSISGYQSINGTSYYQPVSIASPTSAILLPSKSITTVVLGI